MKNFPSPLNFTYQTNIPQTDNLPYRGHPGRCFPFPVQRSSPGGAPLGIRSFSRARWSGSASRHGP